MQDCFLSLLPQPQHEMCAVFEFGCLDWQQDATLEHLFAFVREIRAALSPMYFFVVLHFSLYWEGAKFPGWKCVLKVCPLSGLCSVSCSSPMLDDRYCLEPLKASERSVPRSPGLRGVVARNGHKAAALPIFSTAIWEREPSWKLVCWVVNVSRKCQNTLPRGCALSLVSSLPYSPTKLSPPRDQSHPSIPLLSRCYHPKVRRL